MTTTKIDVPTPDQKEEHRKKLAKQIKEYLAKGGKVTQCPPRTFTKRDGAKRKFDGSQFDSLADPIKRTIGGFVPHKKGD